MKPNKMRSFFEQAMAYWNGESVESDFSKALVLLEKGAATGDPDCLYCAGVILQDGLSGRFDRALAFDYIEKAADMGHIDAIYSLGYFYMNGGMGNLMYSDEILAQKRVIRDEEKGFALVKQAAQHLHPHAILRVARYYKSRSKEHPELTQEAIEWYAEGIKIGEGSCMVDMADILILGQLVDEDREKARELYEKAKSDTENTSARNAAIHRLENFDELKTILGECE